MQLGAFAYLQKPVNIDLLSDTLKKAHARIQNQPVMMAVTDMTRAPGR
jgi:DNA-binding NtrC family response regulator